MKFQIVYIFCRRDVKSYMFIGLSPGNVSLFTVKPHIKSMYDLISEFPSAAPHSPSSCSFANGCLKLENYRIGNEEDLNRESERALIITASLCVTAFLLTTIVIGVLYQLQAKRERRQVDVLQQELISATASPNP